MSESKSRKKRGMEVEAKCFFDLFRGYYIEDKISFSCTSMSNPHFILLDFVKNKICLISNLTSSKGGKKVIHWEGRGGGEGRQAGGKAIFLVFIPFLGY